MRRRKGQIAGQAFIYILALIIFSAILLYGYNAIQKFNKQSEELLITQLTNEIEQTVERIESQYGSVEKLELEVPDKFDQICFTDIRNACQYFPSGAGEAELAEDYPLIYDSWKDCTGENMFLVEGHVAKGYSVGPLAVIVDDMYSGVRFTCADVAIPRTTFRLKGLGEYAEISNW